MPTKNSIKTYVKNGYYHIYNRGVEKRTIFEDTEDHKVFLKYLKEYLSPPPNPEKLKVEFTLQGTTFKGIPRQHKNFSKDIILCAFCLMTNHFHLLLKQKSKYSIHEFMKSLGTRYAMYFNKKNTRVGQLFQGRYKAVLITKDEYLLHLSRYIHLNPQEYTNDLTKAYSSYADYLGLRKTKWVKTDFILSYFNNSVIKELKKVNDYKNFVEKSKNDAGKYVGNLALED
ncbi:transposase [Patescibacteria group bacterium]|nr:transposase [Patescibacteria group bacterium]